MQAPAHERPLLTQGLYYCRNRARLCLRVKLSKLLAHRCAEGDVEVRVEIGQYVPLDRGPKEQEAEGGRQQVHRCAHADGRAHQARHARLRPVAQLHVDRVDCEAARSEQASTSGNNVVPEGLLACGSTNRFRLQRFQCKRLQKT